MKHLRKTLIGIGVASSVAAITTAIAANEPGSTPSITPKAMADALHLVMDSDRTIYTRKTAVGIEMADVSAIVRQWRVDRRRGYYRGHE